MKGASDLWTEEEDALLIDKYNKWYNSAIAEELNRTEASVRKRAMVLGLSNKRKERFSEFSEDDTAFIKKNYDKMHTKIIAEYLAIGEQQIRNYAISLGLKKSIGMGWTPEEDEFLKNNASLLVKELCQHLKKTKGQVQHRMRALEIKKPSKWEWAAVQIEFLVKNCEKLPVVELSKKLNKSPDQIRSKMKELNLNELGWNDEKDLYLALNLSKTYIELSQIFGVSAEDVSARVNRLGLKKLGSASFSIYQEQLAEANQHLTLGELSDLLNMKPNAVRREMSIRKLVFKKNFQSIKKPEEWQKEILLEYGATETAKNIGKMINETAQMTGKWLVELGLKEAAKSFSAEDNQFIKDNIDTLTASQIAKKLKQPRSRVRKKVQSLELVKSEAKELECFSEYILKSKSSVQDLAIEVHASRSALRKFLQLKGVLDRMPDKYSIRDTDEWKTFFSDSFNFKKKVETYGEWFLFWFKSYREQHVTKVTAMKYFTDWRHLYDEGIGNEKLKTMTRSRLQRYVNWYGETHAKVTVFDHLTKLRSSFQAAFDDGLIKLNPAGNIQAVYKEQKFTQKQLKEKREEKIWLEIDEYQKLRYHLVFELGKTLLGDDDEYNVVYKVVRDMAMLVTLKTGLRFSEVMGLTRSDIDAERHTLNIDKTWISKGLSIDGFSKTKNVSSIREIVVDDELIHILKMYIEWQDRIHFESEQGCLFVFKDKAIYNSDYNTHLKNILEGLGIEPITMHKLRHTQATYLLSQGVPIEVVAKRLGHTDTNMIRKVYAHLLQSTEIEGNRMIKHLI